MPLCREPSSDAPEEEGLQGLVGNTLHSHYQGADYNIYIYDDDDDDFSLFHVHLLDNYKDRSPGIHMRTLPLLDPTSCLLVTTKT